jgi:cystathionine gamma-synthase/O-succinylhomoserine sulfhydrylase
VAQFVEGRVPVILYPALKSHPQHDLAMKQMSTGGTIFSIELDGGRAQAHGLLDALKLIDISNNIGDSRSLMCHPATTTHHGVGRKAAPTWALARACCASTWAWKMPTT